MYKLTCLIGLCLFCNVVFGQTENFMASHRALEDLNYLEHHLSDIKVRAYAELEMLTEKISFEEYLPKEYLRFHLEELSIVQRVILEDDFSALPIIDKHKVLILSNARLILILK